MRFLQLILSFPSYRHQLYVYEKSIGGGGQLTSSDRAVLTLSEEDVRTKMAVFPPCSISTGSFASAALLLRAFFGLAGAIIGVDIVV